MRIAVQPAFYWLETALCVLGAGIAGTLWWAHRENIDLPCTSSGGCDLVNASQWSHLTFGPLHAIPIALLGFLTYLLLLTLAMMKIGAETEATRGLLHWPFWAISIFGAGYSWYLQYVAHFEVGAFCVWCFSSAVVMTLLCLAATVESLRRLSPPRQSSHETRPSVHV